MSLLDAIRSLFSGSSGPASGRSHVIYVRCKQCGEPLSVRVDLANDLSPEWHDSSGHGSDYPDYYTTHKTVIGSGKCYSVIDLDLRFTKGKRLESQTVRGGSVISEEEYQQALEEWEARASGKREQ